MKFLDEIGFSYFANRLKTMLGKKVDKVQGKGLSTEDYKTEEKEKLASVETGANKYTHPTSHPASMITESATRRFVSDTEKATWNSKGVVNIGTFNSQQELIGYVLMKQLPTGQYVFLMNGYSYLMLLRDWESNYKGVYQDNEGIYVFFEVTKTGQIDELTQLDMRDILLIYEGIDNLYSQVSNKVDKVSGKQLSTEDYTNAEKNKLKGIEQNANHTPNLTLTELTLGGRFKLVYNDIEDSLDIEVI